MVSAEWDRDAQREPAYTGLGLLLSVGLPTEPAQPVVPQLVVCACMHAGRCGGTIIVLPLYSSLVSYPTPIARSTAPCRLPPYTQVFGDGLGSHQLTNKR